MEQVDVNHGSRSYPIFIGSRLLNDLDLFSSVFSEFSLKNEKVVIISNDIVAPLYLSRVEALLEQQGIDYHVFLLPDGEQQKNLDNFEQVIHFLLEQECSRNTLLLARGGGVIGDLTGFVSACYMRGTQFIQLPTTLLAQVDSSVGGKTAVNHTLGKNIIGAFHQPEAVIIDVDTLSSLPEREYSAGMAEIIKYGLMWDQGFFSWLEQHIDKLIRKDPATLIHTIKRCCEIKAQIVAEDEQEKGIRALLNLGHTFGHAIETHQGYGQWLHGEAVAMGMVMAAKVSVHLNQFSVDELQRIQSLLKKAGLPTRLPSNMSAQDFQRHMKKDKKKSDNKVNLILLNAIGQAVIDNTSYHHLCWDIFKE